MRNCVSKLLKWILLLFLGFLFVFFVAITLSINAKELFISVIESIVNKDIDNTYWIEKINWKYTLMLSFFCLGGLYCLLSDKPKRVILKITESDQFKNRAIVFCFIISIIISCINVILIEISIPYDSAFSFLKLSINSCIVLMINLIFVAFSQRWHIASLITTFLMTLLAIVNHYVAIYHGEPLFPQDLAENGTVINVINGYTFEIDKEVAGVLLLFFANVFLSLVQYYIYRKRNNEDKKWNKTLFIRYIGFAAILFLISFLSLKLIRSEGITTLGDINNNGYLAEFGKSLFSITAGDFIIKPNGYSEEALNRLDLEKKGPESQIKEEEYPDIILILNETWYDLSKVCGLKTDYGYMDTYESMDASIKGYAITPSIAGGTNRSEFELLTSNSVSLLKDNLIPFRWLDFSGSLSVVSYLKSIGYNTMAAHCFSGDDYRRRVVWPQLGFDRVYFYDSFPHNGSHYGNRDYCLDSDAFKDFEEMMEELPEDRPRLGYLLTMQNHGGWDLNDSSYDKIHVLDDFGEVTDTLNEYLTCEKMTDEALMELIDHYKDEKRHTIIMMVGDHAPNFVGNVVTNEFDNDIQLQIAEKSVPFFIWMNYETDFLSEYENGVVVDMCSLVPLVLKSAGMPLSSYQESVLNLTDCGVIHSMSGVEEYISTKGISYNPGNMEESLKEYYYLEYNSMGKDTKRKEEAFLPAR